VKNLGIIKSSRREDREIWQSVGECGMSLSEMIAGQMQRRSTKQCPERSSRRLSINQRDSPRADQEDRVIALKIAEFGPKWTRMVAEV
jgi:hypothetical protein